MISHRHRPVWQRHSPRRLALLVLRDALVDERALHPTDSPTWRAVNRAVRAIATAIQLEAGPPET